jgi:hypothetical protein
LAPSNVETGLAIHVEPVVRGEIEGAKRFPFLFRTLLKIFVEHLLPTRRVEAGGVRYYAVGVKKDGVVLVTVDVLALAARYEIAPFQQPNHNRPR